MTADGAPGRAPAQAGPASVGPLFIGSEIYRGSTYGTAHPLRIPRVSTVIDLCRALDWFGPGQYRTSPRARPAALHLWHDPDYVAALQAAEQLARAGLPAPAAMTRHHALGTLSNPIFPEVFRRPATGVGGTMLAAELLRQGGVVHVPGGGTHHGMPDRANGFCYLNDVVLGMLALRRVGVRRIAYVDIDAHHCDGVQHAFAGDPEALLVSVHEERRWPFTGALEDAGGGNCFNLPVPAGLNDTEMRAVLDGLIIPGVTAFRPDAIVLQSGSDALAEDPLSRLALSNNAHRAVASALRPLSPRFMLLGGGGYNPWTVGRLWALLWADLAGHAVPDPLPDAGQAVLRGLSWGGGGRPPPDEALLARIVDEPREGPIRADVSDRIARLALR